MKIGEELLVRAKVVDFDSDHQGSSIKVEIKGFMDSEDAVCLTPYEEPIRFWIHRSDKDDVIKES